MNKFREQQLTCYLRKDKDFLPFCSIKRHKYHQPKKAKEKPLFIFIQILYILGTL